MTGPLSVFGLLSPVSVWEALFLTVLSYGVGVLGGIVGLALGAVRLPFLLLLGVPAPVAAGTNILVSTLSAATGSVRHLRDRRGDPRVLLVQGVPAVVGAFAGGFMSGWVPEALLIGLAGVLVVWQGVELLLRARGARSQVGVGVRAETAGVAGGTWSGVRITATAIVGFAIGLLGGAVGLILGSLRLPALIMILGTDPRVAAGSTLLIGVVMGTFGWVGHMVRGQVDYPLLGFLAATAMVGTYQGARLTGTLSIRTLLRLMGGVLLVVGSLLVWEAAQRT